MMSNLATALPGVLWDTSMKGWHALILSCGMAKFQSTVAWTGTATSSGLSVMSAHQMHPADTAARQGNRHGTEPRGCAPAYSDTATL